MVMISVLITDASELNLSSYDTHDSMRTLKRSISVCLMESAMDADGQKMKNHHSPEISRHTLYVKRWIEARCDRGR